MFLQHKGIALAAGLLTAGLGLPAWSAEVAEINLAPDAIIASPSQPVVASAEPVTRAVIALGNPTGVHARVASQTRSARSFIAFRPIRPSLILGVRH
jgi:hypothetical protein